MFLIAVIHIKKKVPVIVLEIKSDLQIWNKYK